MTEAKKDIIFEVYIHALRAYAGMLQQIFRMIRLKEEVKEKLKSLNENRGSIKRREFDAAERLFYVLKRSEDYKRVLLTDLSKMRTSFYKYYGSVRPFEKSTFNGIYGIIPKMILTPKSVTFQSGAIITHAKILHITATYPRRFFVCIAQGRDFRILRRLGENKVQELLTGLPTMGQIFGIEHNERIQRGILYNEEGDIYLIDTGIFLHLSESNVLRPLYRLKDDIAGIPAQAIECQLQNILTNIDDFDYENGAVGGAPADISSEFINENIGNELTIRVNEIMPHTKVLKVDIIDMEEDLVAIFKN